MSLNFEDALAKITEAATKGLTLAAENVLEVSNRAVPLEEGTLMRSGKYQVEDDTAAISYDTVYAVYQHERMDLRHENGRTAKYLEVAVNEQANTSEQIIGNAIRQALED